MATLAPAKKGYMMKLGGFMKTWKRRFFVLRNQTLEYFEDETAFTKNKSPLGSIPVTSAQLSLISPDTYRRDHAFGVQPAGKSRTYVIIAEGEESLKQWLAALRKDGALMDDAAAEPQVPQTVSPFSQKEGFLWKMGAFVKSWHSRYFVLESEGLHYYKNKDLESTSSSLGTIPLVDAVVSAEPEQEDHPGMHCFSLHCKVNGRKYMLLAGDAATAKSWIQALTDNITSATAAASAEQKSQSEKRGSTTSSPTASASLSSPVSNKSKEPVDEAFFENVWPNLKAEDCKTQANGVTMGWLLRWDDRDKDDDPSRYWKRRWVVLARATRTMRCWLTKEDAHPKSGVKPLKTFLLQGAVITSEPSLQCSRCVGDSNPQGGDVVVSISVVKTSKSSSQQKMSKPMYWAAPNQAASKVWHDALAACVAAPKAPDSDDEDDAAASNSSGGTPGTSTSPVEEKTNMNTIKEKRAYNTDIRRPTFFFYGQTNAKQGGANASPSTPSSTLNPNPESIPEGGTATPTPAGGGSRLALNPKAFSSQPAIADRVAARLQAIERSRGAEEAESVERERKSSDIKELIKDWVTLMENDICQLLLTLRDLFPAAPKPSDTLKKGDPNEVKNAYQAAIKFVHPDKLENPTMGEKLLSEAVFDALKRSYDAYKAKQG